MKKSLILLVLFSMFLILSSCNDSTNTTTTSEETTTTTEVTSTTETITDAVFSGVENVTIGVGETFSKVTGITATDHDGTDLTDSITAEGIFNGNKPGAYIITYKVTGENGVEITASRTITVLANAKFIGIENIPTSILIGTEFNPLEGVTAEDHDGTDLTDEIIVSGDIINEDGTVDTSTPGDYDITLKVKGSSNVDTIEVISLTIYDIGDAEIIFNNVDEGSMNIITKPLGSSIDYNLYATAKDYDGTDLTISSVTYEESLDDYISGTVFTPEEEGEYDFTYKVTGQNGEEVSAVLTLKFVKQGVIIDGTYIPVTTDHINNDTKPGNSVLIYTELKGMGEYGVIVLVDSHGRITLVRDCYSEQIDITNPIKTGHPDQLRGKANNDGWTGANSFVGLLGPQGTEGGIPEGGFAIYFSMNRSGTHTARELGLKYARELGAKVDVVGLDIPGYTDNSADDAVITGVEDIEIVKGSTFNPLDGVSATDKDGSTLTVEVVFNNVDTSKSITDVTSHTDPTFADGWYSVVYKVTGENGYSVFVTRRVNVRAPLVDAVIEGADNITISVGETFDPLTGVSANDYNGADITSQIIVDGTVDINTPNTYTVTYKVTGTNGVEVIVNRTVTVAANARFEGIEDKTIYVGLPFDPLTYVQAFDFDDTELTDAITISGTIVDENGSIDTSSTGDFVITLTVTGASNNPVEETFTLHIIPIPNASINFNNAVNDTISSTVGTGINLLDLVTAVDYDESSLTPTIVFSDTISSLVVDHVFTPTESGSYTFTYSVTGVNGEEVAKSLTIDVVDAGIIIDGVFVQVKSENINNDLKPGGQVLIYTELKGMGEYGVLVIVDAYGRVVFVRDAFGEQVDINNPIKSGNPNYPTNLAGLPNFSSYSQYTGGLWDHWTKGGADEFEGLLGPQGTEGGIPEGGFAIYFSNGGDGTARKFGLMNAREYAAKVEVVGLTIPGYNPDLADTNPVITGIEDIELTEGATFNPLDGVTATDADGETLTVNVVFTNVDTSKPVIPGAPRSVNDAQKRADYVQGWYSVVYEVVGDDGYTMHVTRRVTVNPAE